MTFIQTITDPAWGRGLFVFALVVAAAILLALLLRAPRPDSPVNRLSQALGLGKAAPTAVIFGGIVWIMIFAFLLIGLFAAIAEVALLVEDPRNEWRLSLIKLTALTATTGAVVTLPLTLWRTTIIRAQTETAQAALFNTKIDAASTGLSARHTVTRRVRNITFECNGVTDTGLDIWDDEFAPPEDATNIEKGEWQIVSEEEPDLVTRATAIDRLEGLVHERPEEAGRVASLLCIYIREHAKEIPPIDYGEGRVPSAMWQISTFHNRVRSDLEKAAQTVGRLKDILGVAPDSVKIDLRAANLQTFDLSGTNFSHARLGHTYLQGANLTNAVFDDANLTGAKMQGVQALGVSMQRADLQNAGIAGATFGHGKLKNGNFSGADMRGIDLQCADLKEAFLSRTKLNGAMLNDAVLQGTSLRSADLKNAVMDSATMDKETDFRRAELRGASVRAVDFTNVERITPFLKDIFGDNETILPGGKSTDASDWPVHWPKDDLKYPQMRGALDEWRASFSHGDM